VPGRRPIIAASFLAFPGTGSYRRICRALFGSASEKNRPSASRLISQTYTLCSTPKRRALAPNGLRINSHSGCHLLVISTLRTDWGANTPLAPPIGCASVQLNMYDTIESTPDRPAATIEGLRRRICLSRIGLDARLQTAPSLDTPNRSECHVSYRKQRIGVMRTPCANEATACIDFSRITRSKSPRTARPFHPQRSGGSMRVFAQSQSGRRRRIAMPGAKSEAA
jgi:hypothetical protein